MKRILTIIALLFLSIVSQAQLAPNISGKVQGATTAFGANYPQGTLVLNIANGDLYQVIDPLGILSTETISSALSKLELINDNVDLSAYFDSTQVKALPISTFFNDVGYITENLDNDPTNELQVISVSNDTIFLSEGGYAVIPSSGSSLWDEDTYGINYATGVRLGNVGIGLDSRTGTSLYVARDIDDSGENWAAWFYNEGWNGDGLKITTNHSTAEALNINDDFFVYNSGQMKNSEYGSGSVFTGTVEHYAAFDADGNIIVASGTSGSGDDWGSQVVVSDATLSGDGTTGNPLSVVSSSSLWVSGTYGIDSDGANVGIGSSASSVAALSVAKSIFGGYAGILQNTSTGGNGLFVNAYGTSSTNTMLVLSNSGTNRFNILANGVMQWPDITGSVTLNNSLYPSGGGLYWKDGSGVVHDLTGSGSGDMLKSVYDPTNVNDDAFDMDNMTEGTTNKILTATERTNIANSKTFYDTPSTRIIAGTDLDWSGNTLNYTGTGGSVTIGNATEIPFVNGTGNDFSYISSFTFDASSANNILDVWNDTKTTAASLAGSGLIESYNAFTTSSQIAIQASNASSGDIQFSVSGNGVIDIGKTDDAYGNWDSSAGKIQAKSDGKIYYKSENLGTEYDLTGMNRPYHTMTGNYTATENDYYIFNGGSGRTLTLPSAASVTPGRTYHIRSIFYEITLSSTSTISDIYNSSITAWKGSIQLVSDGLTWYAFSQNSTY